MKRIAFSFILFFIFSLVTPTVYAKIAIITATALTGGTTGCLDNVECDDIVGDNSNRSIATGDKAEITTAANEKYTYIYNASGTSSESSPNVIVPDDRSDCSGAGQWELQWASISYLKISNIDDTPENGTVTKPISSNWAYDFAALIDSTYLKISDIDDTPVDGETAQPISSNYVYDHVAAADPHAGYMLESNIGTEAGGYVQLDYLARLPAVDGSLLTNVPITGVSAYITNLTPKTSQPLEAVVPIGTYCVADNDTWDPNSYAGTDDYEVLRTGENTWVNIRNMVTGALLVNQEAPPLTACIDPQDVYDNDGTNHVLVLDHYTSAAQTVTALRIDCGIDPTTEATLTFQHKAAGVGYGSPTTIEAVTTTAGVANVTTGIDDATIPAASKIFVTLSDPDNAILTMSIKVEMTKD